MAKFWYELVNSKCNMTVKTDNGSAVFSKLLGNTALYLAEDAALDNLVKRGKLTKQTQSERNMLAAKPEAKPAAKPEAKPEAKPAAKPEAKPEAKPAAKPEAKPAAKPEAKPAAKPEAKPEAKPAAKPEADADKGLSF